MSLGKVEFNLQRADKTGEITKLTTDDNGDITFGNLEANTEYILWESSIKAYPWYDQLEDKDKEVSLTFTVDKSGKIDPGKMTPSEDYFKIDGTRIGILNYLILGGADFKKVDAQSGKELAVAKFKVQKVADGETFWAVFNDDQTFVKWVNDEAQATVLTSKSDGKFGFTGVPYVYDKHNKNQVVYNLIDAGKANTDDADAD